MKGVLTALLIALVVVRGFVDISSKNDTLTSLRQPHGLLTLSTAETPRSQQTVRAAADAKGYFLREAAEKENARCLDGTPGVYYHRPGSADGTRKWYIHHQVRRH